MAIKRLFLDWTSPALMLGAKALLRLAPPAGPADLSSHIVALPVSRAGRRLLELLIEEAQSLGRALIPPRIVTLGELPELLYEARQPAAGPLACKLAWIAALKSLEDEHFAVLVPRRPDADDLSAWVALADQMASLHQELSAGLLSFADVPDRAAEMPDFHDELRWHALAEAQRAYLDELARHHLADLQAARFNALQTRVCRSTGPLVLFCCAELSPQLRAMIAALDGEVTAMVHAPPEMADLFDDFGAALPDAWADRHLNLADERIHVVQTPGEQVDRILLILADLDGSFAADQITIGVADETMAPMIEQRLADEGLPVRYAAGRPVAASGPARFLTAASNYLATRSFADFAALLRHPDVQAALQRQSFADAGPSQEAAARRLQEGMDDWLTLLDRYYADHLQSRVTGNWLGQIERQESLKRVHDAVHHLLGALTAGPRPLNQWAQPIADVLVRLHGHEPLDRRKPHQAALADLLATLQQTLLELHRLPDGLAAAATAGQTLTLLLGALQGQSLRPEPTDAAVEMLGWLELHLDDAPVHIITGVNEGQAPATITAHPFLPNALRTRLGLTDNHRRMARDRCLLAAIVACRPRVELIAPLRTLQGDPLLPSRLLLAESPELLARRVHRFYVEKAGARPVGRSLTPAARSAIQTPPLLPADASYDRPSISVTAFRDYLACPYRFYLRHVLRLSAMDDSAREMAPGDLGTLTHRVLQRFAKSPLRDTLRAEEIADFLADELHDAFTRSYGADPLPAARIQIAQVHARLRAFADWQARRAQAGWRIIHAELCFDDTSPVLFEVDGVPIQLHGRIDRVDQHDSGRWAVLDYKTADAAKPPDKTHGPNRAGDWADLQLPLYRLLVERVGVVGDVGLGYVQLPADLAGVGESMADWDAATIENAYESARNVVRGLRAGMFEPSSDPVVGFNDYNMLCGSDQLIEGEDDDEAEGGAAP